MGKIFIFKKLIKKFKPPRRQILSAIKNCKDFAKSRTKNNSILRFTFLRFFIQMPMMAPFRPKHVGCW